jgi:hypothetical protein
MADYKTRVWNNERIYMVDFGRAPHSNHPSSRCPDVDRFGFMDDANAGEHGPIVSAMVGQFRVHIRFYRTELSTNARLYARVADGNATIRMLSPTGPLPSRRATNLVFRPVRKGRTSINIHYHWPDGPVIGRLYVDVRNRRRINVRVHLVSINGSVQPAVFLGQTAAGGTAAATHHANVIRTLIRDTNRILRPHGLEVRHRDTVNTNWLTATYGPATFPAGNPRAGAALSGFDQLRHAMALSPNRSAARLNIYIADRTSFPAGVNVGGAVGLGPPLNWARTMGATWTDAGGTSHVGNGIWIHSSYAIDGKILAHEFGHILHLSSLTAAGAVNQWHSIGDFTASRDDSQTRRRLMYPYTSLLDSEMSWRNNVGNGNTVTGALLNQRRAAQDGTGNESQRAYNAARAANLYTS